MYRNSLKIMILHQKKFLALSLVLILAAVGLMGWKLTSHSGSGMRPQPVQSTPAVFTVSSTQTNHGLDQEAQAKLTQSSSTVFASSSVQTTPAASATGLKIYRNDEFGFEFQYPQNWIVLENSFASYYSKFNVIAAPTEVFPGPFLVNIVLPEFADRTFLSSNPSTSTVSVSGRVGIEYKYVFEEEPETAIVLPMGQYKVILGTTEPFEKMYYQILKTFRFLK